MATTKKPKAKKPKKKNKYTYYKIIQGNYGYGWEDLSAYETDSQGLFKDKAERERFKYDKKAYRENERAPHRVIFRKELND